MSAAESVESRLISWGWDLPPGEDLFVAHVAEYCPGYPLNPANVLKSDFWHLDYSFTPHDLKIGDNPWHARELNAAYLIPRYVRWRERMSPDYRQPPHKCAIAFRVGSQLELDRRYYESVPRRYTVFRDPDGVLANSMTEIAATARTLTDRGYWVVHGLVLELIRTLLAIPPAEPGLYIVRAHHVRQPVDPVVSRATAYLQLHLADYVEVEHVARHLGIAGSTLSHHFKIAGRGSPKQVLQALRIQRAKALLVKGWKLDAIAAATGFCSGFHLSRVFKKVEGVSPAGFAGRERGAGGIGAKVRQT